MSREIKDSAPELAECPICFKKVGKNDIEIHVNRCIFLNTRIETNSTDNKRNSKVFGSSECSPSTLKKVRLNQTISKSGKDAPAGDQLNICSTSTSKNNNIVEVNNENNKKQNVIENAIPLAEKMRPNQFIDFVGQNHVMGENTVLRNVIEKNEVPSMILWGPSGCGKTTLAHIIANQCKQTDNSRFVKLSATMVGVNDVKEVIKVARNDQRFNRKTILFMDEIHRFNKLQQDIFLPHVESGVITLIGATTENPSFSLNSSLLSRCRVIVLDKLETENMYEILSRAIHHFEGLIVDAKQIESLKFDHLNFIPKLFIEKESIMWLAEMCDGDARIALNSLQLAMQTIVNQKEFSDGKESNINNSRIVSLDTIKEGIKKSHLLYDRKGDQHYDIISALHKSIRASDDNAALYWCTRMMLGGEDPRYICRRLVRAASEDIGLADPQAVTIALSTLNAVQLVGMPESDCIIAQCAIYLARAPKNNEAYLALNRCKQDINECKGPLPGVPLHLRNAPTKLMKDLGYGKGYNTLHKDLSQLDYMPEGMEDRNYFL